MAQAGGVSAGEVGGIIAGIVAALAALGKGIQWLVNWRDARADTRAAKLNRWYEELQGREAKIEERELEYRKTIEDRLTKLALENRVLRMAFELVSEPLHRIDPENANLAQARDLLAKAFPLDPLVPPEMGVLLGLIERGDFKAA